jgi:DNA-binding LytR/AlgR family response regulator
MNAIIIEDEKLSAEHLELLLKKTDPEIRITGIYDSVKTSVQALKEGPRADLLFVDIHLADGLSFEIFAQITINTPVIFTTAYDEYAIKAFKVNSVDYLLKPIGREELKSALLKFRKLSADQHAHLFENISNAYNSIHKQYKTRFMVKMGDNIIPVKVEEVIHFIAEDGIVLMAVTGGKRYPVDFTLDQLETMVNPDLFFRINRKVLLHINSIEKVSAYFNSRLKVVSAVLDQEEAVVSRERVNEFKKWLEGGN